MAATIQKGGFGLDKLFRRRSRSPDEANGDEKNGKITGANEAASKVQRSGSKSERDKPSNDAKNDAANEVDDAASGKTEVSKKSKRKKSESGEEMAKTKDKTDDEETCKEYVIKDDVGQVKLTEIINNSIKEAVLSIVKESVCPLAESLEPRPKETSKKSTAPNPEETQDKENKPESPKNLSMLMSSANKTFDSHLCRSQCQSTNPYQTPLLPTVSPQRTIAQCNRELCPRVVKERKTKCPKPREKKTRDVCPKVTRQAKGSSHFKTDNRRMTGNVNIYICSEANENTKDPKKKSKDENQCLEAESESASETKTCASNLSLSTSKLVAALRKKKRSKTLNDESLSCLCETSDSSQQNRSVEKINGSDDDVLCLCDDNEEPEFIPDSHSSSSRDGCLCEDAKFSDTDFPDSAGDSDFDSFDRYSTYDKNKKSCTDKVWLRDNEDCTSYSNASKRFKSDDKATDQEIDSCCSCCNLKHCKKDRKGQSEKSCNRNGRTPRDVNGKRSSSSSRCPCIVEEEDEDCCANREESVEEITVCTNKPIDEGDKVTLDDKLGAINAESESGELKKTGSPDSMMKSETRSTDDEKDASPEKPKVRTMKSKGSSGDREPKEIVEVPNKLAETSEIAKDSPVAANEKRRDSFFRRSMNRAMSIVKARKDEDSSVTKKKTPESSVESQTAPQSKSDDSAIGQRINKIPCVPCCEIVEEKPTIVPCGTVNAERRSRSRISTAIASRRSLAATSNIRSCVSLSPCQDYNAGKSKVQCQCEKPAESCDCCCKKAEPIEEDNGKCRGSNRRETSNSDGCCKKLETSRPEISARCSACRNPVGKCMCQGHKPKVCACCPRCKRPMSECICHCEKLDKSEDGCCECCGRPKRLCRCERGENSPGKCRRSPEVPENRTQCKVCRQTSDECRCERKCCDCNDRGPKSMICMYCDQPRDKCVCRAPIRKCSQCCMPLDVCNCKPTPCCDCSGRQIQQNDNGDATMCVTAWKPRRKVRRYFERGLANGNDVSDEDCACWEKPKPYGSDRLAYQKRGVFSDVMSELQQKISGSVCCNVCGKEPCCCCCVEEASDEKMETAPCFSAIAERRSSAKSRKRSQSKSPIDSCRCEPNPRRRSGRQSAAKVSRICDRCRTSPCRCKRPSASPQKKPQAKCYYCKMSPCTCKPVEGKTNSRSLRNNDSSHRRRKKRCGSIERDTSDEFEKNDKNGHSGREDKRFVPCSGNQQQRIRKYCYRGNSNGHSFIPGERVR